MSLGDLLMELNVDQCRTDEVYDFLIFVQHFLIRNFNYFNLTSCRPSSNRNMATDFSKFCTDTQNLAHPFQSGF